MTKSTHRWATSPAFGRVVASNKRIIVIKYQYYIVGPLSPCSGPVRPGPGRAVRAPAVVPGARAQPRAAPAAPALAVAARRRAH